MELSSVLSKVRKLIERAEYPGTPDEDAKGFRELADAMMFKYKLDEAMLDSTRPAETRIQPEKILVPLVGDSDLAGWMGDLAENVAGHCDCLIRRYWTYADGAWQSRIYGYPSDLRYFEILYTELRLHMVGALRPGIDPNKSVALNAYILHNAGMNWFDMAQMEGWKQVTPLPGEPKVMYLNSRTGERQKWSLAVGKFKQGYEQEILRRNEPWLKISPGGMETFRYNAAYGYVTRISQRLREIRTKRQQIGTALALRVDPLQELFHQDDPKPAKIIESSGAKSRSRAQKYRTIRNNPDAYQAGVRQANSAALDPSTTYNPPKEIQ